ncbi:hypothetical protein BX616_000602 [Lobosporangium transversale]|uniref:Fork-head domain-containing protein n=1 Tax=Lobosporangium transversale TaxID=64571 RepID=A0A1Y2GQI5_9FUNG|nr:hypothetical protein BCR41DRAFT_354785 [Lobosporangium transversale]KAF9917554.1 hypothetical protein BX616_000602 [Lobosporangium transversale]ORZ14385.1 hypothetical protein BCR41DRAFT_354785 [Lobosporangium transversale]|eukprot:XP_021880863.1 hypothetical protein BCR41DRAFT_354785 [Lobosporangium transversale]
MSTPPLSPSTKTSSGPVSPSVSRRKLSRTQHSKPNESWFLILVNAFKSNFEQTLTYRESELYAWIMQAYPYYRHDTHTMQTSVKTTLSSYECFRQNGRSTWTFIPRRALVHLESLKSQENRRESNISGEEDEEEFEDEEQEIPDQDHGEGDTESHYNYRSLYTDHPNRHEAHEDGPSTRIRYVDKHLDLMDEDSPTLSIEEIQRFKQEHSGTQSRKLKRKASGEHGSRPRTRSPPAALQDECSMSMKAWYNLLVHMFEASPKQKTIREIFAWVHDNYPIYRDAPDNTWQKDLTAALESNPLFKAMGRGRWQMVTQTAQPIIVVNEGTGTPGSGSATNPPSKVGDDATDSPSVTEDEDWKAIGSKRLLNFSFRRYSIATDTVPKNQYKIGSTVPANSDGQTATNGKVNVAIIASPGSSLSTTASGGNLLPLDHRATAYNTTGRRFSSYHQPTPKNSPPLAATTTGLLPIEEIGNHIRGALSQSASYEEDSARRYMAPLQNAINSAVLALQSQQPDQHQNTLTTVIPATASSHIGNFQTNRDLQNTSQIGRHEDQGSTQKPTTALVSTDDASPTVSSSRTVSNPESQVEPEILIPNSENLASDQMDAIHALALLCGGGV